MVVPPYEDIRPGDEVAYAYEGKEFWGVVITAQEWVDDLKMNGPITAAAQPIYAIFDDEYSEGCPGWTRYESIVNYRCGWGCLCAVCEQHSAIGDYLCQEHRR